MAARNTVADVRLIFAAQKDTTDATVQIFLDTAALVVDQNLVGVSPLLSDDELTKIELFLAAHLVAIKDKIVKDRSVGDSKDTYEGWTTDYWGMSHYGQHAVMFDRTKVLMRMKSYDWSAEFFDLVPTTLTDL